MEWHTGKLFPRAGYIVTNSTLSSWEAVKTYNGRGEVENRIKEGKNTLRWDKTSCRRFDANQGLAGKGDRAGGWEFDYQGGYPGHRRHPLVASGSFRKDLYYRLNVFPISIPPLKDRQGDIGELASYFLRKKHLEMGLHTPPSLSPEAMAQLMAHDWPGNVRELENAIERALIISTNGDLDFARILASVVEPGGALQDESLASYDTNLDQAMRRHIQNVMNLVNGRVEGGGGAADLLGVKPSTLRHRMRKLHISFGRRAKSISG